MTYCESCGYPLLRSGVGFHQGKMWLTYICPNCNTIYVWEGRYAYPDQREKYRQGLCH